MKRAIARAAVLIGLAVGIFTFFASSSELKGQMKHENYGLVVFDFDGTLCDSFRPVIGALNEIHESYGFRKVVEQEVPELRNFEMKEVLGRIGIGTFKLPFVVRRLRKLLAPRIATMGTFDGIPGLIADLNAKSLNVGVLTSNSLENVNLFLSNKNMKMDFVSAGSSLFGKARHLNKLKNKVTADVVRIYVGDETRDMQAAKEAGFVSVAVTWGYNTKSALERVEPDYIAENASMLEEVLEKISRK